MHRQLGSCLKTAFGEWVQPHNVKLKNSPRQQFHLLESGPACSKEMLNHKSFKKKKKSSVILKNGKNFKWSLVGLLQREHTLGSGSWGVYTVQLRGLAKQSTVLMRGKAIRNQHHKANITYYNSMLTNLLFFLQCCLMVVSLIKLNSKNIPELFLNLHV